MTFEQLKLILDTVGSAGEGAYTLAVLYILKGYFFGLVWLGIIWLIVNCCFKWVIVRDFGNQIAAAYFDSDRWGESRLNETAKAGILKAVRNAQGRK